MPTRKLPHTIETSHPIAEYLALDQLAALSPNLRQQGPKQVAWLGESVGAEASDADRATISEES